VKNKPVRTDLHHVTNIQAGAGNCLPIHQCTRGRAVVFQLVSSIGQLVNSRVQATDSQVFQEDVAFTAAPNSHLRLYFKTSHCTSHAWELQPGNSAAARIDGFFNVQFTTTR